MTSKKAKSLCEYLTPSEFVEYHREAMRIKNTADCADSYNKYIEIMNTPSDIMHPMDIEAAAFCAGWATRMPLVALDNYLNTLDEVELYFCTVSLHDNLHDESNRDSVWGLFKSVSTVYLIEHSKVMRKQFNTELNQNMNIFNTQLIPDEVALLNRYKKLYRMRVDNLPPIFSTPEDYVVPYTDDPFTMFKLAKNVTVITNNSLTVKLKPLSDNIHIVARAEFKNGVEADPHHIMFRCGNRIFLPSNNVPYLWYTAANLEYDPSVPFQFRYCKASFRNKVTFTL